METKIAEHSEESGSLRSSPSRTTGKLAIAILLASLLAYLGWKQNPMIIAEDHFMEWAQALLLLLAFAVHARKAVKLPPSSNEFLVRGGAGVLALALALRELDIDKLGASDIWAVAELVLRGTALAMLVAFLAFSAIRLPSIWRNRSTLFRMTTVRWTFFGCLLYVASWPFDKGLVFPFMRDYTYFLEELLELNACITLFAAALAGNLVKESRASSDQPVTKSHRQKEKAAKAELQ